MTQEEFKMALEAAYLAGFNASGEGYNAEFPFDDRDEKPYDDHIWRVDRDNYIKEALAETEQEPVAIMREMLEVQGQHGNWNYDSYMHGLYNGMEYMVALAEKREPKFRNAPDEWLAKYEVKRDNFNSTEPLTEVTPSQPESVQWGVDWGKAGDIPCVCIIKRLPNGGIEVIAVEYAPYSYTQREKNT